MSKDDEGPHSRTVHGYFVLQASAAAGADGTQLSGVLEDLTTGAKRTFGSAAEMASLMTAWAIQGTATQRREAGR